MNIVYNVQTWSMQLSRRPIQLSTAQDVQVQMIDALAAVRTVVHHNAEAFGSTLFAQLAGDRQQVTESLGRLHLSMALLCYRIIEKKTNSVH